jgi:hypothetical protein
VFAVDICGFAVLSNHLHLVLRIRPDVGQEWSDEEVARRWWRLFPRRDSCGASAELKPHLLAALLSDRQRVAEWRNRTGHCQKQPEGNRPRKTSITRNEGPEKYTIAP